MKNIFIELKNKTVSQETIGNIVLGSSTASSLILGATYKIKGKNVEFKVSNIVEGKYCGAIYFGYEV